MTSIHVIREDGSFVEPQGVQLLRFAGGEPHVNITSPAVVRGAHFIIDVRSGSFADVGDALVASDALRRARAGTVSLLIPYLPGARQDRGVPLTAKVYADVINAAGFDHVLALDPHSLVMPALLDRFSPIDLVDVIPAALFQADTELLVIAPDAGAAKRAEAVADAFSLDVIHARKHRNSSDGRLSGFHCPPLPDGVIGVVVDDICDGGATFLGLAEAIGADRSHLRLWTTHAIYARGTASLREKFSLLAASDSLPSAMAADLVAPISTAAAAVLCDLLGITTSTAHALTGVS